MPCWTVVRWKKRFTESNFPAMAHNSSAAARARKRFIDFDSAKGNSMTGRNFDSVLRKEIGLPAGFAVSPDGKRIFVANLFAHTVSQFDVEKSSVIHIPLDQEFPAIPGHAIARPSDADLSAITKRADVLKFGGRPVWPFSLCLPPRRTPATPLRQLVG